MFMNKRLYWIGLAVFPLLAVGLYVTFVKVQAHFRYDNAYFTTKYQDVYAAPGLVAFELEQALRTGDTAHLAVLQGLRQRPRPFEPMPNVRLLILWEVDDANYFNYLYFDERTYLRYMYHFKEVRDRWVVVSEDAYFYFDSGRWLDVFTPLAAVWWGVFIVVWLSLFLFQRSARIRAELWHFEGKGTRPRRK